jgi:16S rRNA (cytosine967-C5)-methyltransferase
VSLDIVRDTAVNILTRVFQGGAYLNIAIDKCLRRRELSERGRRFMTQLAYGTVRHKTLCDYVLKDLVNNPLDELPPPILNILRMGVFQSLFCSQVTFPSMVHTSVDLAKHHGHLGLAKLTNAVLRRAPQSLDKITFPSSENDLPAYLSVRYSTPRWLIDEWIEEFGPETASALCSVSNAEAPPSIRVNTLRTTPEKLTEALAQQGCTVEKRTPIPEELTLVDGLPPARVKLFREGNFLVQDAASMLAPHLLEPRPQDRVLDLCAAPGGKTAHLAQLSEGEAFIAAMDVHPGKLRLVRENFERLGLAEPGLVCGNGTMAPFAETFDRVLVDAPCSGLGTLRRHPDLKWRVTPQTRESLSDLQKELLRSGVRLCKNGGVVVYSVCTISRQETIDVVNEIMETENVGPESGPEWMKPWQKAPGQYRTFPHEGGLDGFFLMRFRKGS